MTGQGARSGVSPSDAGAGPLDTLGRLARRPCISCALLLLLQLKVMWGIWRYRDLAIGDESAYYTRAFLWLKDFSVDIAWSPLYTSFLGTLMRLSTHAYFATTLHRVLVVLALDIMILALMRRLLPDGIAWLIAAWWALLPITFDTVSTVHLFAVIPVVSAWLLILGKPRPWTRGGAIALLLATTILVRNEYLVATVILTVCCLRWETTMAARVESRPVRPRRAYLLGYGLPLAVAGAVILFFYARSIYQLPELWSGGTLPHYRTPWSAHSGLKPKHTYNMCQVYAFGYQQRHPEWTKNPMLECSDLMASVFGAPLPSLAEMLRRNPLAVLRHFGWNIALTPSGIQLLLFNAAAGAVNPDYFPAQLHSFRALILSLILGAVVACGAVLLYRDRHYWWEQWLRDRALGWLAMLSVGATAGLIIPTQRPRPSYLFPQGLLLMTFIGMCVFAMSRRWRILGGLAKWLPLVMLTLVLTVPRHRYANEGSRPLLTLYERLAPFEAVFNRPDSVFLASGHVIEIHDYVGHNYFTSPLVNFDYGLLAQARADQPLSLFLDREGVNVFYIDEALWQRLDANPAHRPFLTSPASHGWTLLTRQKTAHGQWMLLQRSPAPSSSGSRVPPALPDGRRERPSVAGSRRGRQSRDAERSPGVRRPATAA